MHLPSVMRLYVARQFTLWLLSIVYCRCVCVWVYVPRKHASLKYYESQDSSLKSRSLLRIFIASWNPNRNISNKQAKLPTGVPCCGPCVCVCESVCLSFNGLFARAREKDDDFLLVCVSILMDYFWCLSIHKRQPSHWNELQTKQTWIILR